MTQHLRYFALIRRQHQRGWLSLILCLATGLCLAQTTRAPSVTLTQPLPGGTAPLRVFAAASVKDVLAVIAQDYTAQAKPGITIVSASSAALARQIDAGAPADIFISADFEWMDYLQTRDRLQRGTRFDLAGNRLVLIAPSQRPINIKLVRGVNLVALLGPNGRLAMADPQHVPAGKYAKAALEQLDAWTALSTRLAPAENVRVAMNFVARGESPLGLVYATDALAEPRVHIVASVDPQLHPAIVYPAAALKNYRDGTIEFLGYLRSPSARKRFNTAGFSSVD